MNNNLPINILPEPAQNTFSTHSANKSRCSIIILLILLLIGIVLIIVAVVFKINQDHDNSNYKKYIDSQVQVQTQLFGDFQYNNSNYTTNSGLELTAYEVRYISGYNVSNTKYYINTTITQNGGLCFDLSTDCIYVTDNIIDKLPLVYYLPDNPSNWSYNKFVNDRSGQNVVFVVCIATGPILSGYAVLALVLEIYNKRW
jgi:uncharacterized membrane protein YeiB